MELLLLRYGYLLLFIGVVLEGEAFLLAGSLLAHRGHFEIAIVAAVALAANTLARSFTIWRRGYADGGGLKTVLREKRVISAFLSGWEDMGTGSWF